ncbi:PREDICTED: protein S100-A7-like [Gavialis gangeticus]|uniref:protein S100-A7-like n=1 Tax=Gavialis gangeticus TaxID=94835 RepID=UPI00092FC280|nr:PREDICTED: protein S100-A7-like [Gavialis gangeticus]
MEVSPTSVKRKTQLEKELDCIVNIYHQYSFRHPMDDYLQKAEFKKLLREQASDFLKHTKPPNVTMEEYLDNLFKKADVNRDGRVKFTEFLITLASVAIDVHNTSHKPGHGHGHSHDA